MVTTSHDNIDTGVFEGETCELLSETSLEIPNVSDSMNENDYITNGSPNGSSMSPRYSTRKNAKRGLAANATGNVENNQQGKKLSRYNRRKQQGVSTQ